MDASFHLSYTVVRKLVHVLSPKNKDTCLWNFVPSNGLENFVTASRSCMLTTRFIDGRDCWPLLRRLRDVAGRIYWLYIVVDRNALPFVVDVLSNLFRQSYSCWQDLDSRSVCCSRASCTALVFCILLILINSETESLFSRAFATDLCKSACFEMSKLLLLLFCQRSDETIQLPRSCLIFCRSALFSTLDYV